MYHLVITYQEPTSREEFEQYYRGTHTPLVKAIPNLDSFFTLHGAPLEPGAQPAWYLQAHLVFESQEVALASLGSEAGQAAAADVAHFATGGATVVIGEQVSP